MFHRLMDKIRAPKRIATNVLKKMRDIGTAKEVQGCHPRKKC